MKGNFRRFITIALVVLLAFASIAAPVSAEPDPAICTQVTEISQPECLALVALYNSAGGDEWSNHTNWLETTTPANWYGVTVSGGRVVNLTLTYNNLVGSIPAAIGGLNYVQVLFLNGNLLSGSIPPEVGQLVNLQSLSLGVNQLTGPLPASLGSLTQLKNLSLIGNHLSGTIPDTMGSLAALETLFLNENQFSGSIPATLGNLANLKFMNLGNNQLSGTIPPALGNLANLEALFLNDNQLTGSIPLDPGDLPSLTQLSLAGNQLSGSIPAALGSLTNLVYLNLRTNQLSGEIPAALGALTQLTQLILAQNQLSGPIPPELGALSNLVTLSLYSNQLSDEIPPELGSLSSLINLYLQLNQLSGAIPAAIGSLTNLSILFLDHNALSGDIPVELANLTAIADQGGSGARLRLDYNELNVPSPYPPVPSTLLWDYLQLKNPNWHLTQGVTAEIDATGGELVSRDGVTITVTVPPGAVTGTITLKLTVLSTPSYDTGALAFGKQAFILSAEDGSGNPISSFAVPVSVRINYQDSDLDSIEDENQIKLYAWNAAWEDASETCAPASTIAHDTSANTFEVGICSLTEFALLGEALSHITGRVTDGFSGIEGVTISAGSGVTATSDADGFYTFTTLRQGTYTLTPSKAGYSFDPVSRDVILAGVDQTVDDFTGELLRFSISGHVTIGASGLEGVSVAIGNLVSVVTDANGYYEFAGMPPGTYTLRPTRPGYAFTPTTETVTLSTSSQSGVDFTAEVVYYTISGRIMEGANGLAGVTVSAGGGLSTITDASGNYTFAGMLVGTYTLTPSKAGYFFTPANRQVDLDDNQSGVNFTGALLRYSISGRITEGANGVAGVTLSDGAGNTTLSDANGNYTLSNLLPGTYTITPSKANMTFAPASQQVTVSDADRINIQFAGAALAPDEYTIFLPTVVR